jgi:hypothetical protein
MLQNVYFCILYDYTKTEGPTINSQWIYSPTKTELNSSVTKVDGESVTYHIY